MPLTRRQRHIRILESFGRDHVSRALRDVQPMTLVDLLGDDGVEYFTRKIVSDHRRQQRYNAENRARLAGGR